MVEDEEASLSLAFSSRTNRSLCAELPATRLFLVRQIRLPCHPPPPSRAILLASPAMSMSGSQTSFGLWIINKAGGLIYSRTYAGASRENASRGRC